MSMQSIEFHIGSVNPDPESQLRAASFLDADKVYLFRITPEQVYHLARLEDGLKPGDVISSLVGNDLPDILDMPDRLLKAGVADWSLERLDEELLGFKDFNENDIANDPDTANNREIELYFEKLTRAEAIAHTLTELLSDADDIYQPAETEFDEDKKARKRFVLDVLNEYMSVNPSATFNNEDAGSLKHTGKFIEYYKARTIEESAPMVETLKEIRATLLDSLDMPAVVRGLGRQNVDALKPHFRNQPIILADPLLTLLKSSGDDKDILGWFEGNRRRCYLDPLTIEQAVVSRHGNEHNFRAQLAKTMAHELVHAASSMVYRMYEGSKSTHSIDVGNQWPLFFYEGMTEKIAYLIAYNAAKDSFDRAVDNSNPRSIFIRNEYVVRTAGSDNPKELLAPKSLKNARYKNPSSYIEYRVLIDTIMDKADWSAAGVSRAQADRLAVSAFLGRDKDIVAPGKGHRKAFMQALHAATTPGILNQLDQIVKYGGSEMALDVLESPAFDITSSELLHVVSPRRRQWTNSGPWLAEQAIERFHQMKKLGAPKPILDSTEELIELNQERADDEILILRALASYLRTLKQTYGTRRRYITPLERLFRHMSDEPNLSYAFPENDTHVSDLEALNAWLARKNETPSYWKKRVHDGFQ